MESTKRQANPNNLVKSRCNMRTDEPTTDDDWFQDIVDNVKTEGVKLKPVVRMEDNEYAVVDGWHRVRAAQEAKLDTVDIDFRTEMSDEEALKTSFTGNEDYFQKDTDPLDRAVVLGKLWEEVGDDGKPSPGDLGEMISVPMKTVSTWLEPFRYEWEGTAFDPTSDTLHSLTVRECQEIGMRKLRSIRKTTDGGEDGEWLAEQTAEHDLTMQDLAQIRKYVNKGADLEDSVEAAIGNVDFEDLVEEPVEDDEEETTESAGVYAGSTVEEEDPITDEADAEAWSDAAPESEELADGGTATDDSDNGSGGWFDEYEPLTDEEKERAFPNGWDDDSDDETDVEETLDLSIEFGAKAEAVQQAAEDLNVTPEKLVDIAMEKYLSEGQYI